MDQASQLRNIIKKNEIVSDQPARILTVTSGKGGVGKSNIAINLAIQMRKLGRRVIILDADFGLANIEIMFGIRPEFNMSHVIYEGKSVKDIITWGPMDVGFISGGSGITGLENLATKSINHVIKNLMKLNDIADVIIIDTGAGISSSVMQFLVASPEILLVTTPEPTSITDSYSLVKSLEKAPDFSSGLTKIKIISNKVDSEAEGKVVYEKLNAVIKKYIKIDTSYVGAIPEDSQITKSVRQQVPISLMYENAKATKAYESIADNILNGTNNETIPQSVVLTFFERMFNVKPNNM